MKISNRLSAIQPSITLELAAKSKALKAAGVDVLDLSAGQPDFDTPANIKAAGIKAIEKGFTGYTPVPGIPELRQAAAKWFEDGIGVTYEPMKEILVSCGAKHSLYNVAMAVLNPGDELIIPEPYWVSYPPMAYLAGAKPVTVPTSADRGFKITPEEFRRAITPKSKAWIINSPSNPSGAAYSRGELAPLMEIALEAGIITISDEIYDRIVYDGFTPVSPAALSPEARARTVVVNGVSKAYSMTGWRIGFTAAPAEIISAMNRIQAHSSSNPTSISQWAALEAITGPQDEVRAMVEAFTLRRRLMIEGLSGIPGVLCPEPEGAFYLFPDVSALLGKRAGDQVIRTTVELCGHLLDKYRLSSVPGSAFGVEGHLRISYASSRETLEKALDRLVDALGALT